MNRCTRGIALLVCLVGCKEKAPPAAPATKGKAVLSHERACETAALEIEKNGPGQLGAYLSACNGALKKCDFGLKGTASYDEAVWAVARACAPAYCADIKNAAKESEEDLELCGIDLEATDRKTFAAVNVALGTFLVAALSHEHEEKDAAAYADWLLRILAAGRREDRVELVAKQNDFAALQKLIRPGDAERKWEEIPWQTDLWVARQRAAQLGKPILLWEMDGNPMGCT